jgi:hypothetical protein
MVTFNKKYDIIYKDQMQGEILIGGKSQSSASFKKKIPKTFIDAEGFQLDCPNYPFVPTVLPPVKRIIAIGDIHGDLNLAMRSFKLAKLIDDNFNWIANPPSTVVIQVGDQVDSCRPIPGINDCHNQRQPNDKAEDLAVINFFDQMHAKASAHGGAVYSLLGNHELMNVDGDFRYVSYANYYDFKYDGGDGDPKDSKYVGPEGRKSAFGPGGPVARNLACTRNSVMIIGSNMFVHAGVLPVLVNYIPENNPQTKMAYLNAIVRKWLLGKIKEFGPGAETEKKLFVNGNLSPFWTRIYGQIRPGATIADSDCENYVAKALEVFQIGKIIVGHTPQLLINKVGINGTCGDDLWRVDGGFSKAFSVFNSSNLIQVLEILDDQKFIVHEEIVGDFTKPKLAEVIVEPYIEEVSKEYSQTSKANGKYQQSRTRSKKKRS